MASLPPAALLALPIAVWELSFGVYMTVKGFKPVVVSDESSAPGMSEPPAQSAAEPGTGPSMASSGSWR